MCSDIFYSKSYLFLHVAAVRVFPWSRYHCWTSPLSYLSNRRLIGVFDPLALHVSGQHLLETGLSSQNLPYSSRLKWSRCHSFLFLGEDTRPPCPSRGHPFVQTSFASRSFPTSYFAPHLHHLFLLFLSSQEEYSPLSWKNPHQNHFHSLFPKSSPTWQQLWCTLRKIAHLTALMKVLVAFGSVKEISNSFLCFPRTGLWKRLPWPQ